MTDRIIFLDINGVILPTRMWAARENIDLLGIEPFSRAPRVAFDPGAVGLVDRVARLSGAKLVLHSSWRRTWPEDLPRLLGRLIQSGLSEGTWHEHWYTPVLAGQGKAQEISAWLDEHGHGVRECLIADDRPIEAVEAPSPLRAGQLRPAMDEGIGLQEYRAALSFFGVTDPRVRKEPSAALWPVFVQAPVAFPEVLADGRRA